jgi:predicted TIM-barrel fold metal-dependent hydrolase
MATKKLTNPKAIDMECLMCTKEGALSKDPAFVEMLAAYFKTLGLREKTEDEMAQDWRDAGVQVVIMSQTHKLFGFNELEQIQERHNYIGQLKKDYPDVVLGFWVGLQPDLLGIWKCLKEVERCIKDLGSFGVFVSGMQGTPANDKMWWPFYDLCQDAGVPIKISVGATAGGAGQGGGMGIKLSTEKPIPNIDDVAALFPNLTVIGHHYPFPWVDEMVAIMIHKNNVYCEVHGWRPKYFHDNFRRELNTRVKSKIMFGSDYPFFPYTTLFEDWEASNYKPEVLQNVYLNTARKILGLEK